MCKYGADCIFSHDPAVLAKAKAAKAKSNGKGKGGNSGKSSGRSTPRDENVTLEIPCKFLYLFDNCKFGKD